MFCVFCVDFMKSESILSEFGAFFEELHFSHRTLPRGPSVQLLAVANLLTRAIILRSDPTKPKF